MTPLQLVGLLCVLGIARVVFSAKPAIRGYLDGLLIAGLVALFLITFVIRTFYIPSVSMVPTLQVGDVVLVDEIAYRLHPPSNGDLAVFTPPVAAGGNDFVKRVIGTPGDSIAISDGIVYRNDKPIHEPYENQPPTYDLSIRKFGIYVNGKPLDPRSANVPPPRLWQAPDRIPSGFYFVLGDNRNYSDDSHVWGFAQTSGVFAAGPLAANGEHGRFIGRAFLILWPLGRLRVPAK